MKRLALLCLLLLPTLTFAGEAGRPMKVDDLLRFKRVADPQISPDGKWGRLHAWQRRPRQNKVIANLWIARPTRGTGQAVDRRSQERPPSALEPRRQVDLL